MRYTLSFLLFFSLAVPGAATAQRKPIRTIMDVNGVFSYTTSDGQVRSITPGSTTAISTSLAATNTRVDNLSVADGVIRTDVATRQLTISMAGLRASNPAILPDVVSISEGSRSGTFRYDMTDTTTPDDGAMCLVVGSKRYKRDGVNVPALAFGVSTADSDNATALQVWLNALPNNSIAELAPGTYLVSKGITLSGRKNVRINAAGAVLKVTQPIASTHGVGLSQSLFRVMSTTAVTVSGLSLDANGIDSGLLGASSNTGLTLDGVTAYRGGGSAQIILLGNQHTVVNNCEASNSVSVGRGIWCGQYFDNQVEKDLTITNSRFFNNGYTGIVLVAEGAQISNCISSSNAGAGMALSAAYTYMTRNVGVTGCTMNNNALQGIQSDSYVGSEAYYPRDITISNNTFSRNSLSGIYAVHVRRWTITGNTCTDNGGDGIDVKRANAVTLTKNNCSDTRTGAAVTQQKGIWVEAESGFSLTAVSVEGNVCTNNAYFGVQVSTVTTEAIDGLSVLGNTLTGNASQGLLIAEATPNRIRSPLVLGNMITGNTTLDWNVSATGLIAANNYFVTGTQPTVVLSALLAANTFTSTQTISPLSDVRALVLNQPAGQINSPFYVYAPASTTAGSAGVNVELNKSGVYGRLNLAAPTGQGTGALIELQSNNNQYYGKIQLDGLGNLVLGATSIGGGYFDFTGGPLRFRGTGNSQNMIVNPNGTVLIGGTTGNTRDKLQVMGSILHQPVSGTANPTTTDITTGNCVLWTNTTNSTTKLFCNQGGTIVSSPALSAANN